MTINSVYNIVVSTMNKLENIDFINLEKRKYNQEQVNKAYDLLDNLKDELIKEKIKNRGEQMKIYGIYDKKEKEQCIRVGTMEEIAKFLDLTAREIQYALKNHLIRKKYELCYLYKE